MWVLVAAAAPASCAGSDPTVALEGGDADVDDAGQPVLDPDKLSSGGAAEEPYYGSSSNPAEAGAPAEVDYPEDVHFDYQPRDQDAGKDACAATRLDAKSIPVDLYIALDRSGSMNLPQSLPVTDQTPGGGDCNVGDPTVSRWCYALNALDGLFEAAANDDVGVALQFFPTGGCTGSQNPFVYACCDSGSCCSGADDSVPAVALGDLPEHHAALVDALNAEIPWGDRTPIEAALRGLATYTAAARRPDRQMVGLLITDGAPEGCASNKNTLAAIVKTHREATGIKTYLVGMQGADFTTLEAIASAGGAAPHDDYCAGGAASCHYYSVGGGTPAAFTAALARIQSEALGCKLAMPVADEGIINPNDVALEILPANGTTKTLVERVDGAAACTAAGGFFYDDPESPSVIELCPDSCAKLAGDGAGVEVVVGCLGS